MTDIFLRVGESNPNDVRLRDPTVPDSGDTTLSPTDGAITLTGQVCSIALVLAVSVGALTLSGNTPALARSYAPSSGAITIGGNAPSVVLVSVLSPTDGALSIAGGAPVITVVVPDSATATPGFDIRGLAAAFRGGRTDEEEKRRRRASYVAADEPVPATTPPSNATKVYSEKSAKLALAISRLHAESSQLREQIAELEARIQAQVEAQERARLEYRLLLANQALLLAQVQEAVLLEEMEVIDVAYLALFTVMVLQ